MKTESKVLATFLAAAVWADGEYNEFEQELVGEIGEELGIKSLKADLEAAIALVENLSEDDLDVALKDAAKKVNASEKEGILVLCLQMLCADAFLSTDEIENFFAFADILEVDEDAAENILDEYVNEEEDLIIEE
ncbi:MAG: hypothetical protein UHZ06_07280 [Paludibacteraceae bacterium]|nr:hypothetical protein [Paludibacteraceae bacterium]